MEQQALVKVKLFPAEVSRQHTIDRKATHQLPYRRRAQWPLVGGRKGESMDGGRGGHRIEFRRRRAPAGDVDEPTAAPRSPSPPPWINSIQPDTDQIWQRHGRFWWASHGRPAWRNDWSRRPGPDSSRSSGLLVLIHYIFRATISKTYSL